MKIISLNVEVSSKVWPVVEYCTVDQAVLAGRVIIDAGSEKVAFGRLWSYNLQQVYRSVFSALSSMLSDGGAFDIRELCRGIATGLQAEHVRVDWYLI